MAIEKLIENGEKLCSEKKYEEALVEYNRALTENPIALKALIAKSIALQRLKRYDEASKILDEAEKVAEQRGSRQSLATVNFRKFTLLYAKNELQSAIKYLNAAADYAYDSNEISLWRTKLELKAKKANIVLNSSSNPVSKADILTSEEDAREKEKRELEIKMATKDNLLPRSNIIRKDWFQTADFVTISVFIKNLPTDGSLKVEFTNNAVDIHFLTPSNSEFQYSIAHLYSPIIPEQSSYKIFSTKLELILKKSTHLKWKDIESNGSEPELDTNSQTFNTEKSASDSPLTLSYPTSSRKQISWDKLDGDEDDETTKDENYFFRQLYKDADDDTRRAMMKSFVESNGTALSTNWEEVSKKKIETSPPDGMEAKDW